MADVKISALPLATTPLAGTEVLPIVQSATTDQVSVANLTAGRAVSAASLTLTTTPLAVGSGGTGLTSLTAGYIPFGAGTSAFGNDSNLFWDNTNKRLGVGTASPANVLDIAGTGNQVIGITTNTSGSPKLSFTAAGVSSGYIQYSRANIALELSADATNTFYSIDYTGLHKWYKASAGLTMTLDNVGNLGLGVTPSAWNSADRAFQLVAGWASISGNTGDGSLNISSNAYRDSAGNWAYVNNYYASRYQQVGGAHQWFTTTGGSAPGNAITFTQAMTLDASGVLSLGTTTNSARLYIKAPSGAGCNIKLENSDGSRVWGLVNGVSTATDGLFSIYDYTAGQARVNVDSSGNVGIGTSSPTAAGAGYVSLTLNGSTSSFIDLRSNNGGVGRLQADNANSFGIANIAGASGYIHFDTNSAERARIDSSGNVIINTAAIATTATDGFLYVPTCAGTPTGTPTTYTGRAPIVVNTTNNKLYFYSGGAWRDAGP